MTAADARDGTAGGIVRLIVFDLDGTLVDSEHHIVEAQGRAFAANDLPAPSRAASLSVVGLSLHEAFAALVGADGPIECLAEAYRTAWRDLTAAPSFREVLYAGAADMIASLAAQDNVRLGIATGKSRRGVDRIIAAFGWRDVFATIQTADEHPSKPDPSMLEAAFAEVGVAARDTLMIGDTSFDMEMARRAGVTPIGVAWGFHRAASLRAAGAAAIAEDVAMLRTILERHGSSMAMTA